MSEKRPFGEGVDIDDPTPLILQATNHSGDGSP